jgi:hypothetical protein
MDFDPLSIAIIDAFNLVRGLDDDGFASNQRERSGRAFLKSLGTELTQNPDRRFSLPAPDKTNWPRGKTHMPIPPNIWTDVYNKAKSDQVLLTAAIAVHLMTMGGN